jgi:hypothetical protein
VNSTGNLSGPQSAWALKWVGKSMQNKLKIVLISMSIINLNFLTTYLNICNYELKLVMKIDKI